MCFQVLPNDDDDEDDDEGGRRCFRAHAVFLAATPSPLVGESGRRNRPVSILGECPDVGAQSTENPVSFEMGDCSRTHAHGRPSTHVVRTRAGRDATTTLVHLNSKKKKNNGLLSHASRVDYHCFTPHSALFLSLACPTVFFHGLPLSPRRFRTIPIPSYPQPSRHCLSTRSQNRLVTTPVTTAPSYTLQYSFLILFHFYIRINMTPNSIQARIHGGGQRSDNCRGNTAKIFAYKT